MVANVVHLEWRITTSRVGGFGAEGRVTGRDAIKHAYGAFGDISNKGEVALHLSVVEHVDATSLEDCAGKQPRRHIRPAPWAVHCEIAQARSGQPIEMAVSVRHQLVGLFAGGVKRNRVIDVVVHGKGHVRVGTIDAGGTGIDKMLDAIVSAPLQQITETYQVGLDVDVRVY